MDTDSIHGLLTWLPQDVDEFQDCELYTVYDCCRCSKHLNLPASCSAMSNCMAHHQNIFIIMINFSCPPLTPAPSLLNVEEDVAAPSKGKGRGKGRVKAKPKAALRGLAEPPGLEVSKPSKAPEERGSASKNRS